MTKGDRHERRLARGEEGSCAYLLKLRHHDGLFLALQLDQTLGIEVEVEPGVRSGEDIAEEGLLGAVVVERQGRGCDSGRNEGEEWEELHVGRAEDVAEGKRGWDDAASTTERPGAGRPSMVGSD